MKVAIVCDNWKLPVFEKALKKELFIFSKEKFTDDTTTIVVDTHQSRALELELLVRETERMNRVTKSRKN